MKIAAKVGIVRVRSETKRNHRTLRSQVLDALELASFHKAAIEMLVILRSTGQGEPDPFLGRQV